ncbi:MAG: tetraacyldisaccharide 4'-kinase [Pseudomonadota bacterium]
MINEPWFWREDTIAARVVSTSLAPFGAAYNLAQHAKRRITTPLETRAFVVCVGNASLGGVGKTPFALRLRERLAGAGAKTAFLSRGFGGSLEGPVIVNPKTHTVDDVGDEALLLADQSSCIVAKDKAAGARKADELVVDGEPLDVLIMDDGHQNPSVKKDLTFLLLRIDQPYTNDFVFPAGPWREPLQTAAARADCVVGVAQTQKHALACKHQLPIAIDHCAWLSPERCGLQGRMVAFAGIGKPTQFFETLDRQGANLVETYAFADHHPYTEAERSRLRLAAKRANAVLVTTAKDAVRWPEEEREALTVFRIRMEISDEDALRDRALAAIQQKLGLKQSANPTPPTYQAAPRD